MFAKFEYSDKGGIVAFMEANVLIVVCAGCFLDNMEESDVIQCIAREKGDRAHAIIAKNIITFMIKDTMNYSLEAILEDIFGTDMSDLRIVENPFK